MALRRASCRARRARWRRSSRSPEVVVAFESPRRVAASLAVLAAVDPERPVAVCRELTKLHEEVVRGSASELAARYAEEGPRGEVVLVIGAAPGRRGPARARAGRAATAGRRGRGAAAAGGRRGGRAHRDERECAVPRADRHEVAQGLQQITHGRPRRAIAAVRSAHAPAPAPRRPRLARRSDACSSWRSVMPRGAAGAGWRWPLRGPVGRRLSPVARARRSRAGSAGASTCRRRPGAARARRLRRARELRRAAAASRAGGQRALRRAGRRPTSAWAGWRVRAGPRVARGAAGSARSARPGACGWARAAPAIAAATSTRSPCWPATARRPRASVRRRVRRACVRGARCRRARPPASAPAPAVAARRLPWPAYPALALVASALPVGGLVRRSRRRRRLGRAPSEGRALRIAGARLTPCNVRCPWPPSTPSTSPRRSTTSTRPRIWGTRTRRSPPT